MLLKKALTPNEKSSLANRMLTEQKVSHCQACKAVNITLYLPVAVQGAYLYLGDGHAAQGDGELTNNAMETSMNV